MPFIEHGSVAQGSEQSVRLGQIVLGKEGKKLGNVRARFPRYILVERGTIFRKAYYIPHSAISSGMKNVLRLSLSENDMHSKKFDGVPDELYSEADEPDVPNLSGIAQFARGPLSPAETGHYHFGRRGPGINTDASGSYYRNEIIPKPQAYVRGKIFVADTHLEP